MARPAAKELTGRELQVMKIFWKAGEMISADARDRLAETGVELTYTTVATLVRILKDKGFLEATNNQRPFRYRPLRSYEDVSGRLVDDLIDQVFEGSRDRLLVHLVRDKGLSAEERSRLRQLLGEVEG